MTEIHAVTEPHVFSWWDDHDRPANAGQKYAKEPLTPAEIQAMIRQCSTRGMAGLRNRALIAVLGGAGLRLAEALALAPRDVDLHGYQVNVRRGKGARQRIVSIDPSMAAIVDQWIAKRAGLSLVKGAPLTCTISGGTAGQPLKETYVRRMLNEMATRAGIEKRVHPHGLRHSFAHGLRMAGVDPVVIQRQLGHKNLDTTQVYLDHLAPRDVIAAVVEANIFGGAE